MENEKHTPGPWLVCEDGINVYAPVTDTAITNFHHPCFPDEDEAAANARLIAAAPELLAALIAIRDIPASVDNSEFRNHATAMARVAIAKAEGDRGYCFPPRFETLT